MNPSPPASSDYAAKRPPGLLRWEGLQRHSLPVLCVAVALGAAQTLNHSGFHDATVPVFICAVAISAWYGGQVPALLAVVLCTLAFDYFFVPPLYTLYIAASELPYFIIFTFFALLVSWFATTRRRVEQDLLKTRDELHSINRQLARRSERTEASLAEINARLEEAQRISHVGYWERDFLTNRISWSDETYRIFGLQPQEHPMDLTTLEQKIHPEDWKLMSQAVDNALDRGSRYNMEYRIFRPTGEVRFVLSQGDVKRDTSGRPTLMFGTVQDITDRKQADQKFRALLESAADAMIVMDRRGQIVLVNAQVESLFGYRREELLGKDVVILMPERFRERHSSSRTQYFAQPRARSMGQNLELYAQRSDGAEFPVEISLSPLETEEGTLVTAVVRDITERKHTEQEREKLHQLEDELAHIGTLNALTASIAHEINQPLASLVTNASICLRRLNADPPNVDGARETARRIIRDGNRASDVITRLRVLFRRKEIGREQLDLNEAAREVIAMLADELARKRVLLLTELEAGLPAITGDRTQIQQVIMNLLRNGSDAMSEIEDRPKELVIRTVREGDRVRLNVIDAGVGIQPEAADRLFQAFYTTKRDGMGVGLSISRSIIEAHQGRLWVTPNVGPGTTFSFSIPSEQALPGQPRFAVGFLSGGQELQWMPVVLEILQDEFRNLDVSTSTQFSPLLAEALSKGQIDAALLRREEGWPDLTYTTLVRESLIVYLPSRHRLAELQEISPRDLVGETFIAVAKTAPVLRGVIDNYFTQSGIRIEPNYEFDHPTKLMSLIISTSGFAVAPEYGQSFMPASITTRPFRGDPPTLDLVLGYKKSNQSPILRRLLSRLDELVARVKKKEGLEVSDTTGKKLSSHVLPSDSGNPPTPS